MRDGNNSTSLSSGKESIASQPCRDRTTAIGACYRTEGPKMDSGTGALAARGWQLNWFYGSGRLPRVSAHRIWRLQYSHWRFFAPMMYDDSADRGCSRHRRSWPVLKAWGATLPSTRRQQPFVQPSIADNPPGYSQPSFGKLRPEPEEPDRRWMRVEITWKASFLVLEHRVDFQGFWAVCRLLDTDILHRIMIY
jgi:hypothetical protein